MLEDGVIDEALGRLKSGKEADVWLVRHGDEVLCAKVYKDRQFRSFKNNTGYKEGRAVRNTRHAAGLKAPCILAAREGNSLASSLRERRGGALLLAGF